MQPSGSPEQLVSDGGESNTNVGNPPAKKRKKPKTRYIIIVNFTIDIYELQDL